MIDPLIKLQEYLQKQDVEPGTIPPRPGLVFDKNKHRWVRPNKEQRISLTSYEGIQDILSNVIDSMENVEDKSSIPTIKALVDAIEIGLSGERYYVRGRGSIALYNVNRSERLIKNPQEKRFFAGIGKILNVVEHNLERLGRREGRVEEENEEDSNEE